MVDKQELLKEFIRNNPSLKASEIYNKTKGTSLGTRKTEVLKTVREVRSLPEPTKQKVEQSTPIKYRKPITQKPTPKPTPSITPAKPDKFRMPSGSYGIAEVFYTDKDSKWIKFKNKADFDDQLNTIKKNYGKKMKISFHGIFQYSSFIDPSFKDLLSFA